MDSYEFKVILCGNMGVGKTSLVKRFVHTDFAESYKPTLGTEIYYKQITFKGNAVILQVWDLAGAPNFRNIRASFYRGTNAALLVTDLTRPETLSSIVRWREEIRQVLGNDPVSLLVGNKVDLIGSRSISEEDVRSFLLTNQDLSWVETSAKTGERVEEAFEQLASQLVQTQNH